MVAKVYAHEAVCVTCGQHFMYSSGNPTNSRRYCDTCQPHKYQMCECTYKVGVCQRCGSTFEYIKTHKSGYLRKYCDECTLQLKRERSYNNRVKRGLIKNPGVGSGNANRSGKDNPCYKNGIGTYRRVAQEHCKPREWKCFYCGVDHSHSIKQKGKKLPLLVHHIDGNRNNNDPSNLRIVCKRCHQVIEHDCSKNLPQNTVGRR